MDQWTNPRTNEQFLDIMIRLNSNEMRRQQGAPHQILESDSSEDDQLEEDPLDYEYALVEDGDITYWKYWELFVAIIFFVFRLNHAFTRGMI